MGQEGFVLRHHRRYARGFTQIDNAAVQDTSRLSLRAIGLLTYLWSLPDDAKVNSAVLAKRCKEGRDAIRTAMDELIAAGYAKRERTQDTQGHWVTKLHLDDQPSFSKPAGGTDDGFSGVGSPGVGGSGAKNLKDPSERATTPHGVVDATPQTIIKAWLDDLEARRLSWRPDPAETAEAGATLKRMLKAGATQGECLEELRAYEGSTYPPGTMAHKWRDKRKRKAGLLKADTTNGHRKRTAFDIARDQLAELGRNGT
jgi:hypothetical protein